MVGIIWLLYKGAWVDIIIKIVAVVKGMYSCIIMPGVAAWLVFDHWLSKEWRIQ